MLRFLQSLLKMLLCWGRPRPEFQKLAVEKDIHHLQALYTCQFFALPLPGVQTDPALILQGAKESTTVTSHKSCLPTAHGKKVKLSCLFDSFNLKFLHGMRFNHWEPNLSWNALNFFTPLVRVVKNQVCNFVVKNWLRPIFWISFSGAISTY